MVLSLAKELKKTAHQRKPVSVSIDDCDGQGFGLLVTGFSDKNASELSLNTSWIQ